eukprot:s2103_g8.t1
MIFQAILLGSLHKVCETTPHDIPAESSESLTVSVQTFGGLGLAGFTSSSSAFQYNWYAWSHDTPLFFWSDGWAGTGGDVVAFQGDVYPGASVAGQFDIRVGGARCIVDQENYPLSSRRRSSLKRAWTVKRGAVPTLCAFLTPKSRLAHHTAMGWQQLFQL